MSCFFISSSEILLFNVDYLGVPLHFVSRRAIAASPHNGFVPPPLLWALRSIPHAKSCISL